MIGETLTYACDVPGCGRIYEFLIATLGPGQQALNPPRLPNGSELAADDWIWVGEALVCPRHDIAIDGTSLVRSDTPPIAPKRS